jgi:hypothetical protein
MAFALTPVLGFAGAIEYVCPSADCDLSAVAAKAVSVSAVWAAVAVIGWTWGGWRTIWREERRQ